MDALVVTHNSARDLSTQLACRALREAFSRIVVVDNDSTDDSVAVAEAAGAEVVVRGTNDSLSAAVNDGARRIDGELFALLNPDVLIDSADAVDSLARHFEDPALGAVAPALRLPGGHLQGSARGVPTPRQLALRRISQNQDLGAVSSDAPVDVDWVVGACLIVRRQAFADVGGFDERYRLYFEDVDFCVRLWSSGWTVRLDPTVVVRHEHRASSRSVLGWAFREHVRSAGRFFRHHPDLLLSTGRRRLSRPTR